MLFAAAIVFDSLVFGDQRFANINPVNRQLDQRPTKAVNAGKDGSDAASAGEELLESLSCPSTGFEFTDAFFVAANLRCIKAKQPVICPANPNVVCIDNLDCRQVQFRRCQTGPESGANNCGSDDGGNDSRVHGRFNP